MWCMIPPSIEPAPALAPRPPRAFLYEVLVTALRPNGTYARITEPRGIGSVGRASRSQCEGQGFDSPILHYNTQIRTLSCLEGCSDLLYLPPPSRFSCIASPAVGRVCFLRILYYSDDISCHPAIFYKLFRCTRRMNCHPAQHLESPGCACKGRVDIEDL